MKEIILVLSFFGMGVYGVIEHIDPISLIFLLGVGAIIILDAIDAFRQYGKRKT